MRALNTSWYHVFKLGKNVRTSISQPAASKGERNNFNLILQFADLKNGINRSVAKNILQVG